MVLDSKKGALNLFEEGRYDPALLEAMVLQWKSRLFHLWNDTLIRSDEPRQAVTLIEAAVQLIDSFGTARHPGKLVSFEWPGIDNWLSQIDIAANLHKLILLCEGILDAKGFLAPGEPRGLHIEAVISLLRRLQPYVDVNTGNRYTAYLLTHTFGRAYGCLESYPRSLEYYFCSAKHCAAAIRMLPRKSRLRYRRQMELAAIYRSIAGIYSRLGDKNRQGYFILRSGRYYRSIFIHNGNDRDLALAVYDCCMDILLDVDGCDVVYWRSLLEDAEAVLIDNHPADYFYRQKLASFYQWGLVDVERSRKLVAWLLERDPEDSMNQTLLANVEYLENKRRIAADTTRKPMFPGADGTGEA